MTDKNLIDERDLEELAEKKPTTVREVCITCNGRRHFSNNPCKDCKGKGYILKTEY